MARAKVVLPLPRSPRSRTASPAASMPAIRAPKAAVAAKSGSATVMRNLSIIPCSSLWLAAVSTPAPVCAPVLPVLAPARIFGKTMPEQIVIVGAGQAGVQAVQTLRAEGFTGAITMIGDEAYPPYQRPPLSKASLLGSFARERLFLKPDVFYQEAGCELILNASVTTIDRAARAVSLQEGGVLPYDKIMFGKGI